MRAFYCLIDAAQFAGLKSVKSDSINLLPLKKDFNVNTGEMKRRKAEHFKMPTTEKLNNHCSCSSGHFKKCSSLTTG